VNSPGYSAGVQLPASKGKRSNEVIIKHRGKNLLVKGSINNDEKDYDEK
jgi:hypothetical protein